MNNHEAVPRRQLIATLIVVLTLCSALLALFFSDVGAMSTLRKWMPHILKGFLLNIGMSAAAMALATGAGFLLALMRIARSAYIRAPAGLIIQICRNTPWLVILFAAMLLFPYDLEVAGYRFSVPGWFKAVIGFAIPVAANVADIVRGAMRSVPSGQWEAAEGLAFTRRKTIFLIILPQCFKAMIPPWMNWYSILALSTPLAAILGVQEVVGSTQQAMAANNSNPGLLVPFYLFVMLLFFLYIWPISAVTRRLERHAVFKK